LWGFVVAQFRYIVSDVNAAVAFYRDRLGLDLVEQYGPAMAILRKGDLDLWVAGPMASASKPMPDGARPMPGGWNRCVLVVDDIYALVASLRKGGVVFRNDIIQGPGGKQILCTDPSGNVVELFEPS
jgi:catechol 2,3-dioxygenase-like lactoylglutathione lyase family enzyme